LSDYLLHFIKITQKGSIVKNIPKPASSLAEKVLKPDPQ